MKSFVRQHDFTTGPIGKQLLVFSLPILLTNLLQVSYQFIDSLWVGNLLGADALGAVALSSTVIFTVLSFIIGVNHATLTILSQLKGKDDEQRLRMFVNAFVVILGGLSLLLGMVGFVFAKNILLFLELRMQCWNRRQAICELTFSGFFFCSAIILLAQFFGRWETVRRHFDLS